VARAVVLLALLVLSVALAVGEPAPFTSDGNTYVEMARAMLERGSWSVDNGLGLVSSRELALEHMLTIRDRLVPKYPPFYPLIAAPFYGAFGIHGLIALNAAALAAALVLFYGLARRLFDPMPSLLAAAALSFATPLFSYAILLDPHLSAVALVLGAIAAALAGGPAHSRNAVALAAGSGALAGLATGVRLQNLVVALVVGWELWRGAERRKRAPAFAAAYAFCLAAISAAATCRSRCSRGPGSPCIAWSGAARTAIG
jgi:4-amino-4-deoxy-L-arabinose transferase-like glycosyltransferase